MGATDSNEDAVFLIQAGGKILSSNSQACRAFRFKQGKIPDLERLARRADPVEAFLSLCSSPGRRRFTLDGRLVDGISYYIPDGFQEDNHPDLPPSQLLLTLHFPEIDFDNEMDAEGGNGEALSVYAEISREISAALDLEEVVEIIFRGIEKLLPTECMILTVFNKANRTWLPFTVSGIPGPGRPVIQGPPQLTGSIRMVDKLVREQKSLILGEKKELEEFPWTGPLAGKAFKSYLGLLLQSGDEIIGTLELGSLTGSFFSPKRIELIRYLSEPAAISIKNALLFRSLQHRIAITDGLAQLARVAGISTTPGELLPRVVEVANALLNVDILGFLLYDETRRILEGQAPFHGLPSEFIPLYHVDIIAGSLAELTLLGREPISSENASDDPHWVELNLDGLARAAGLRESLLVPVVSSGHLLGYLQASNHHEARITFNEEELRILTLCASIVAPTLALARSSAIDYENKMVPEVQEETSIGESLARAERIRDVLEIAVAASRQSTSQSVLATLANEILILMEPDVVLVAERTLEGITLSRVIGSLPADIKPETYFPQFNPLRQVFETRQLIQIADLEKDLEWHGTPLLRALNTRGLICLPLVMDERVVAAILVIFSKPLPAFTEEDQQVYHHLAHQVVIRLQNLNLLSETRRRLHEVNLLLEFSRQLDSLDQVAIVKTLLTSVMKALPSASAGMVALWDDRSRRLLPQAAQGYADDDALLEIIYYLDQTAGSPPLPLKVFLDGNSRRVDDLDFASGFTIPEDDLVRYHRATGGSLPVSCLLVPIWSGDEPLALLLLDNFSVSSAFTAEDETIAASLAKQSGLALENARLYASAEQRASQLQALTKTAETMTSSLQLDELVASLLDQLNVVIPFDTAALWLRQDSSFEVVAARGFSNDDELQGLSVTMSDNPLFNEMMKTGQPLSIPDVRGDTRFRTIEISGRQSWLGLPLIAKDELVGVIAIEKREADFYSDEQIQVAGTFAGQATIALENARLFEESLQRAAELDRRSNRLALLNRLSGELGMSHKRDDVLHLVTQRTARALDCSVVSAIIFNNRGQPELHAETPENSKQLPLVLPDTPLLTRLHSQPGIASSGDVEDDPDLAPLADFLAIRGTRSLLAVPMMSGSILQGILLLHTRSHYHFTPLETELALTIGNQAAVAIQNVLLTQNLEQRIHERTTEMLREHRYSETLLGVITALSSSLEIEGVLDQTLSLINRSIEAGQSAIFLHKDGYIMPYFRSASGQTILAMSGGWIVNLPEEELASLVLNQRQAILIEDLTLDQRCQVQPGQSLPYQCAIGVPLEMRQEILGVLTFYHERPGGFDKGQLSLVEAAAHQISVALHNANLFNLVRDQADDLGQMLELQLVETSRSRAILEAVADGVLVTDANSQITLFNLSAERHLSLQASQVIGQSLDQFSALFGRSGRAWLNTIQRWSNDPDSYKPGEAYRDQFTLETGQVIAITLAPVFLESKFLGSVSIFRDITNEVKVDRMKSEFVANVSHELRTPMTSIKGYIDLMLMGASGPFNEQQQRFLEIIKNNTRRLNILVNGLLDVSRIEAGHIRLSYETIDVVEIAREIVSDLKSRSHEENKQMDFIVDASPGLPMVECDPLRIRQIISNLLTNSYSYTPEDGRVVIHLHCDDDHIQVDVEDNGVGISKEEQERIFERFYRGEHPLVLATSGTGLGLSIVKTLVEMHHGQIWFSSSGEPGKGTVFSFSLPLHQIMESSKS